MAKLKRRNRKLKTLLAVGGWQAGTGNMSLMLKTVHSRRDFVMSSLSYLRKWKFDGISLDFAHPGSRNSPPEDKGRFTRLCKVALTADVAIRKVLFRISVK